MRARRRRSLAPCRTASDEPRCRGAEQTDTFDTFRSRHKISPQKSSPKAGCGFHRSVCARVCQVCVCLPGGPDPDGACDFHHVSTNPVSPRSPRWYRKRSSHIVPRRRQIAYINRQRPFIFPCQRFCGIILAPCRDFSSPNKRVKINRRVVAALYWDGIIPFTSLNAAGGQSNQGAGNVVIPGDFHRF